MTTGIYRVRATLSGWTGGPGLATHYFVPTEGAQAVSAEGALVCAGRVRAAYANLLNMFPAFMTITTQPVVDVLNPTNGELAVSYSVSPPANVVGDAGGLSLPQASMLAVNWLTEDIVNGHRVRGRTFVGPLKANQDADGTPTSTQLTQMGEYGSDIAGFSTDEQAVVWHRPVGGSGGSYHLIKSWKTADRFAMLRSRRG